MTSVEARNLLHRGVRLVSFNRGETAAHFNERGLIIRQWGRRMAGHQISNQFRSHPDRANFPLSWHDARGPPVSVFTEDKAR